MKRLKRFLTKQHFLNEKQVTYKVIVKSAVHKTLFISSNRNKCNKNDFKVYDDFDDRQNLKNT